MVRISLDQRRQSLSVHIEEGLHPQVRGDERRLKQILVNILDLSLIHIFKKLKHGHIQGLCNGL